LYTETPQVSNIALVNGANFAVFMKEFDELKAIIKQQMPDATPTQRNVDSDGAPSRQISAVKLTPANDSREKTPKRGSAIPMITARSSLKKQNDYLEVRRSGGVKKPELVVPWYQRRLFDPRQLQQNSDPQPAGVTPERSRQSPYPDGPEPRSRSQSPGRASPQQMSNRSIDGSSTERGLRSPSVDSARVPSPASRAPPSSSVAMQSRSPNKMEYPQGIIETLPSAARRSPSPHKPSSSTAKQDDKASVNGFGSGSSESGGDVREKLAELDRQLVECDRYESFDSFRGVSVDRNGNSQAVLAVTVISAKNLIPMKRLTKSSDPYVELTLTPDSYSLTQRTTTCWNDLFPKWNETITFRRLDRVDSSCGILLTVRDAVKRTTGDDAIIGSCAVPFSLLMDQRKHLLTLPLVMPEKRAVSLPIMIDGTLRVEMRLMYLRSRFLRERIDELRQSLGSEDHNDRKRRGAAGSANVVGARAGKTSAAASKSNSVNSSKFVGGADRKKSMNR